MYCPKCGNYSPDEARFCQTCGNPLPSPGQDVQNGGQSQASSWQQNNWQQNSQNGWQSTNQTGWQSTNQNGWQQTSQNVPPMDWMAQPAAPAYPMKWYNFLVKFALWFGAVMNILSGITFITGMIYESSGLDPDLVYATFPGLRPCDILFGAAAIAAGVLGILARGQLVRYTKNAPNYVYLLYGFQALSSLIYAIVSTAVIGVDYEITSSAFFSFGLSAIIIACNRTYFRKRAHLFVN